MEPKHTTKQLTEARKERKDEALEPLRTLRPSVQPLIRNTHELIHP
jgi:hypothetical protein